MPRLLLYYHFFHPNDVVSARQFSDLAVEQVKRGWEVIAVTSDRDWNAPSDSYPAQETWQGVDIRRVHRPAWPQARAIPRLGNSAYLLSAWAAQSRQLPEVDAIVVGSDPAFSPTLAIALKRMRPTTPIFHWCFDLYPEAIEAEAEGRRAVSALVPLARRMMAAAYRRCDVIVDIGQTMRRRLEGYGAGARHETLVPWALFEPEQPLHPDPDIRASLFPNAKLALLYAGTMGRAHDFEMILRVARACRAVSGQDISFCFACRGNRMNELRAAVGPEDINISFAPFAAESELPARLAAADVHIVSLRAEWEGIVVPSKFFASLAVGRPVLFAGPNDSEIAQWIATLGVGLSVSQESELPDVVAQLHALAADSAERARWQLHAHRTYSERFSKRVTNDRWDELLRETLADANRGESSGDPSLKA